MDNSDIYTQEWAGEFWTEWFDLYSLWREYKNQRGSLEKVPSQPGIYRIRHSSDTDGELTYIGQSGNLHKRIISQLAGSMFVSQPEQRIRPEMPYRAPHTASPCIWALCDRGTAELELSFTSSEKLEDKQLRETIEDTVTAIYRREIGESPTANFARMIPGYKQSTYPSRDPSYRGGKLNHGDVEPNSATGVGPVPWTKPELVTSIHWLGLDWSVPRRLEQRKDVSPPDSGVYRIWYDGQAPPLAYVGESSNLSSRFYTHEKNYGSDALFSFVRRTDLDAQHKRREIETDLIGAHYLECGCPPLTQYGRKEAVPDS